MDSHSSAQPQWSWPRNMGSQGRTESAATSNSSNTHHDGTEPDRHQPREEQQRHYGPRTCRICLEVVQPTTELDDSAAGIFTRKARVKYISEDPELGRLISPCKCKGSQRYVHEGCLQAWRQAAPLRDRNFWQCPTCHFQYRIERLKWGRWLSSWWLRGLLTTSIMLVTIFLLGFVADPIINLWLDPLGSIGGTISDIVSDVEAKENYPTDEPVTWSWHFLNGFLSLGLLGFLKTFLAMSPWQWFYYRYNGGIGSGRRRGTGRDRLDNINWYFIIIGVITFMGATWKLVSHFSARMLESATERVVDIQGDEPDEDDGPGAPESRKDI